MDLKLFSDDYDHHVNDLNRWPGRYDFQTIRNYVILQQSGHLEPQALVALANRYQLVNPGEPVGDWATQFTYDRKLMQFGYVQYLMATYYTMRYHINHSESVSKAQREFMNVSLEQYVQMMAEQEANRTVHDRQYDHFDVGPSLQVFLNQLNLSDSALND